jgi:cytochrome P450
MLFLDPPDHGRLRNVMQAAFRPAALHKIVPDVHRMVDDLLDGVDAESGFDFMTSVAQPLPARVIAKLMGIGRADHDRFGEWTEDLTAFIGAVRPTREQATRAQSSLLAMSNYFEARLAIDRPSTDGVVGGLLQAQAEGRIRGSAELLAQCAMLLFAGYETTRNLLGNGLQALLDNPTQWRRLLNEPALLPSAVRELLRFDCPVQYTGRRVATDFVLHGHCLKRGDLLVALIGAANRDPEQHNQPDRLDVTRNAGSLSFGSGPHVCIGAALTQIEAHAVFSALLRRWPKLGRMETQSTWNGNPLYRGLTRLLVRH